MPARWRDGDRDGGRRTGGDADVTAVLHMRRGRALVGVGAGGGDAACGAAGAGARDGARGPGRLAQAGGVCGMGRGKLAGVPEVEQVAEAGKEAGEAGEDEDVQGRDRPGPQGEVGGLAVSFRAQGGKGAGGAWGQGGGLVLHFGQFT